MRTQTGPTLFSALVFTLTVLLAGPAFGQTDDKLTATLKIVREANLGGVAVDYDVFVNDKKIGSVANGKSIEITIPASKELQTVLIKNALISEQTTQVETFQAKPGAVLTVTCETNFFALLPKDGIKIKSVKTDKEGVWPVVAKSETEKKKDTATVSPVSFDQSTFEVEVRRDKVESEIGGTTTYRESRTVKREVSYSTKLGLTTETEAKTGVDALVAKAELTGRIKASVEAQYGEKWSDEILKTAEHTINLDKNPKVEVVWYDVYRSGTVEVTADGKTQKLKFQFPIATRTVLKASK